MEAQVSAPVPNTCAAHWLPLKLCGGRAHTRRLGRSPSAWGKGFPLSPTGLQVPLLRCVRRQVSQTDSVEDHAEGARVIQDPLADGPSRDASPNTPYEDAPHDHGVMRIARVRVQSGQGRICACNAPSDPCGDDYDWNGPRLRGSRRVVLLLN